MPYGYGAVVERRGREANSACSACSCAARSGVTTCPVVSSKAVSDANTAADSIPFNPINSALFCLTGLLWTGACVRTRCVLRCGWWWGGRSTRGPRRCWRAASRWAGGHRGTGWGERVVHLNTLKQRRVERGALGTMLWVWGSGGIEHVGVHGSGRGTEGWGHVCCAKLMTKAATVLDGTWSWRSGGPGRLRHVCL